MFSLRSESKGIRTTLIGLIVAVFLMASAIVLYYGDGFLLGTYEKLNNDDVKYVHAAEFLISDGTLVYNSGDQPSTFIMPGLPIMVAAFRLFLERSEAVMAFRLFQCALQAASVYLLFIVARDLFRSSRIALGAAVLSALYLPDYYSSGVVLTETTFKFLLLLSAAFLIEAIRGKRMRTYVAVGICWAAMTYLKPQSALFPAVIGVLWLFHRYTLKEMLKFGSILAVTFCLLLSPWWIRNLVVFKEPILLTRSAGNPFLLGALIYNAMPPQGFLDQYPEYKIKLFQGSSNAELLAGKRLMKYGFTHHPLRYLSWYTVEKFYLLFDRPFYWRPLLGLPELPVKIVHLGIFYTGAAGIILSLFRRKFVQLLLPLLLLGYFSAVYLPFVTFTRYGYPLMPIILMFASYAGTEFIRYKRERKGSRPVQRA